MWVLALLFSLLVVVAFLLAVGYVAGNTHYKMKLYKNRTKHQPPS